MPYNVATATKGITVLGVTLKDFKVTPAAPWTAGQSLTLQVQSVQDTTPRVGKTIRFLIIDMETGMTTHVDATTGSNGYATTSYTIPWTIDTSVVPCGTLRFRAYDLEANILTDPIDGKVAYPTRISISAPDQATAAQAFTITGKLEYQSSSGVWSPLTGRTVSLFYNGNKIADVTTGSDGSYSLTTSIPTSGTYTLKALYPGEGFGFAPALARIMLAIPETVKPLIAPLAAILAGGASIGLAMRR